jgi:phosphohistidine phosphatase SixA
MTTYNVFVSVGMASRGRRAPQSINKRDDQKKNAERASDTANDTTHEYATKVKAKMQDEHQLVGTAGHLPGADAVFSSFNRRLENDGIRPRNVASLAEPRNLRAMLRFALVLPLHDDIRHSKSSWSEL